MKVIKEILETFKKPLIVLGIMLCLFFVCSNVIPFIKNTIASKSPIIKIEAKNEKVYSIDSKYNIEDFTITAYHKNGDKTKLSSKEIKLSKSKPDPIGSVTKVQLTTKEGLSCIVNVKTKRDKYVTFECGNPNVEDVRAVLYTNGELCFEGSGDILAFKNEDFPWKRYDGMDTVPIRSISFEEGVSPSSMDGYFASIETLVYVKNIPTSVESMVRTFYGCIGLEEAPDISNCTSLLDMTETYSDCTSLKNASIIPESVRNSTGTYSGCTSLQKGADVNLATSVKVADYMYYGCSVLNEAVIPPKTESIINTFAYCINLKKMPNIPNSVKYMNSCFSADISLIELSEIPSAVVDVSDTFNECSKIRGTLIINGTPENYSGFLTDAVVSTNLDLQGAAKNLNELALTSNQNFNITINGESPKWDE